MLALSLTKPRSPAALMPFLTRPPEGDVQLLMTNQPYSNILSKLALSEHVSQSWRISLKYIDLLSVFNLIWTLVEVHCN